MAGQNTYISSATTSIISTRPCVLERITVNKAAANGVITIYDGPTAAAGTVKGIITSPGTLLQNHFTLEYGTVFPKGLTIVTTVAAQDITVIHKPQ